MMLIKTILAGCVSVLLMQQTLAADDSDKTTRCGQYSAFAKQVMTLRQQNVPVSSVVDKLTQKEQQLKEEGESNDGEYQFYLTLTKKAYAAPLYTTPHDKQAAVDDFTNQAYLMCLDDNFL